MRNLSRLTWLRFYVNSATELAPAAHAKGLELTAAIPDNEVYALGETTDLRRLFLILVDNAIKYTEAGSINLSLTSNDAHVERDGSGYGDWH